MTRQSKLLAAMVLLTACSRAPAPTAPTPTTPSTITVPAITREFRGMWIATVANIDWPSATTLSATQQRSEMDVLLDVAVQRRLNAVILQVRAAGDALYPSTLEPWARSLSGTQGVDPGYDPLSYAVSGAHTRGLELHAWFNPFRAGSLSDTNRLAPLHLAKRRPDLLRVFCTQLWFDPGEPDVQDQAINVISDVVRNYGVDAVHLDDFFYPYPNSACPNLDFPDSATYAKYVTAGGTLARADWRRDNVNRFVERMYTTVHALAPSVKVGISPFGIWRPGNPSGVTGLDSYASIYADSRLWLQRGWVDYFAPQLYWSIASTGQSFPALLTWWGQQNSARRHLWPGLASYRVNDGTSSPYAASEIPAQVSLARDQQSVSGGATGTILYNGSSVRTDRGGFATQLSSGLYSSGAVVPASPWLDAVPPSDPSVTVAPTNGNRLAVTITGGGDASWFLIRWHVASGWDQKLLASTQRSLELTTTGIDAVVVNAIDRAGNASANALWRP